MDNRTPILRNNRQQSILDAAERLFADQGFHAVTLRQIADAAQVPLALVGYYFGRKHDLFRAIFDHRRVWHLDRFAAMDEARRDARSPNGLARIVESFVLPLVQLRQQPAAAAYVRLLARELLLGSPGNDHPLRDGFEPLVLRFVDALQAARPGASPAELAWACQFTLGAAALYLRDERIERLSMGRVRAHDPAAAPRLVRYIVGGLDAVLDQARGADTQGDARVGR